MTATGGILKALPLQISALASRQASRTQKGLLSASTARTSHSRSAHTRSGVSAPATGKSSTTPPSVDQHETEPDLLANSSKVKPRAVSDGKLPPNYDATARRVLTIMVGLPIVIVTSYVLFERVVLGKEQKRLVPRPEKETSSVADDDLSWDSPNLQPDKNHDPDGEQLR